MKALVIIAHGSKKESANNEFILLVNEFRKKDKSFFLIKAAFLELAQPSIPDIVKDLVDKKIDEIIVYPYFLNQGKHVLIDIPKQIKKEEEKYKDISFKLLEHFGSSSKILDIIKNDVEI